MLLAGFFYALDNYYITKFNVEAGYERADILLFPRDKLKAGYILELKRGKESFTTLELEKYVVKEIIKLGDVFDGKKMITSNN